MCQAELAAIVKPASPCNHAVMGFKRLSISRSTFLSRHMA